MKAYKMKRHGLTEDDAEKKTSMKGLNKMAPRHVMNRLATTACTLRRCHPKEILETMGLPWDALKRESSRLDSEQPDAYGAMGEEEMTSNLQLGITNLVKMEDI